MYLVLGLGTNLGDKISNLQVCIKELNILFGDYHEISKVYCSEPLGPVKQDDFLNLVVVYEVSNNPNPHELLTTLKSLEVTLGRKYSNFWGPRLIDIDILFLDDLKIRSTELTIPHNEINQRSFVVQPLESLKIFSYLSSFYKFSSVFQTKSVEHIDLF